MATATDRRAILGRMLDQFLPPSQDDVRQTQRGGHVLPRRDLAETVRTLTPPDGRVALFWIGVQWVVVIAAAMAATWAAHPLAYAAAIVVIATRQHAIAILVHEACHWSLFANRRVNDLVADLLCGLPAFASVPLYRNWHFPHHRHVNGPDDPEVLGEQNEPMVWRWPGSPWRLAAVLGSCLVGPGTIRWFLISMVWCPLPRLFVPPAARGGMPFHYICFVIGYYGLAATLITMAGFWWHVLWFWIVPMFTVLVAIFHLRSFAEHKAVPDQDELSNTRTTIPSWWERLLLSPVNIGYHLEHHLFPSVPFHRLPRLHAALQQHPSYAARAEVVQTYCHPRSGVIGRLLGRSQGAPRPVPAVAGA
jgi:fatty acid desaturase